MDNRGEVPDRVAERSREQQGTGVLHPSHTLPPWVAGTTMRRTESPAACHPPAMGPSQRQRCAGCRRRCSHWGGGGGGEEARRTPGGGEEYNDWGRKIGWGGRGSARAGGRGGWQRRWPGPGWGPRGGERAWARRTMATARDRTTARWMPPCCVSEGAGGLFSRLPSIVADPWTAMARTVGISVRVIGVT